MSALKDTTDESPSNACSCFFNPCRYTWSNTKKKSEKCRKSDLEWWLKCRRFLSKNVITKAHLCNRVRQCKSSDENFFLTNSDPGLCHVCF